MIRRTAPTQAIGSVAAAILMLLLSTAATAGDWPQILGPQRNGVAEEETIPNSWAAGGPRMLWTAKIGSGYAGPAVVGKRAFVFHRVNDVERIEALDVASGRSLWHTDFQARYRTTIDPDNGPRCAPVVHKGKVYVFGAAGDLHCVDAETGKKAWTRELYVDYNGDEGYFGAGSTPLPVGDRLLVNVGGDRDDAGIVAVSLSSGKTLWKKTSENASYSSPMLANIHGRETAVFLTRMNTVGVDPQTGEVRFTFPFGKRGPTVNAATPLVIDNQVFVSASYGLGSRLEAISAAGDPKTTWANDAMASQYATSIFHEGNLYGVDGREDIGVGRLRCIDFKTGKVRWTEEDFGVAHLIKADGKLLALKVEGGLVMVELNPRGYRALDSAQVVQEKTRALPALSNGRMFIRVTTGRNSELQCIEVGKTK